MNKTETEHLQTTMYMWMYVWMRERERGSLLAAFPQLTARRAWWRRDATASSIPTSCCVPRTHNTRYICVRTTLWQVSYIFLFVCDASGDVEVVDLYLISYWRSSDFWRLKRFNKKLVRKILKTAKHEP